MDVLQEWNVAERGGRLVTHEIRNVVVGTWLTAAIRTISPCILSGLTEGRRLEEFAIHFPLGEM